jgi:hypothetical protein
VHVPKLPEPGEEPETAPNVVSAAFREADTSTVSADLRLNITRMIEGGDAADEWIAWARTRLAAMNDAISKSSQAVMDARYRAYHISMIDSSTDSVYAPHTRQPIAIFEDGKMMPNARHPYYLGRELVMWLREHRLLENPQSLWYLADQNRASKYFLGQPFQMNQAGGYFAGIKDELDGSTYNALEAVSG